MTTEMQATSPASGQTTDKPAAAPAAGLDLQKVFAALQGEDADARQSATAVLQQWVAEQPDQAPAWLGLGIGAAREGRWTEAQAHFERALAADPKFAQAQMNLGNLHRLFGRRREAQAAYEKAIALQPGLAEAHYNLAILFDEQGRSSEADAAVRRALLFRPDYPEALNNLGHLLMKSGKVEQGLSQFRQALAWQPNLPTARSNLVVALYRLGRNAEAEAEIARLLAERPDDPQVLRVQAAGLVQQGQLEAAAAINRRLMELQPEAADLSMNQGEVLLARKDYAGAEACYRGLLDAGRVAPAIGLGALAQVRAVEGRYAEAKGLYQQALMLDARLPPLNLGLARTLLDAGETRLGLEMLKKAVELFAHSAEVHSLLVDALRLEVGAGETARQAEIVRWRERHDRGARRIGRPSPRKAGDALRVGFIVGDLERGGAARALVALLPALDATRFDVFVYHTQRADTVAVALQPQVAHWRPALGLGSSDLAEQIRQDGIDVLIDTIGHGAGSRLQSLTEQPAALQLSWLGDAAKSGLTQIDAVLTAPGLLDAASAPADLPAWMIWRPVADVAETGEAAALPAAPVFGVLAPLAQVSPACLDAWAEVLRAVPDSRLLWLSDAAAADDETRQRFQRLLLLRDIDPQRLDWRGRQDEAATLRALAEMSVVLDSFPLPLGSRALDVLWAGRPLVTLAGSATWQRTTASLLTSAGWGEWVAASPAEYVERAVAQVGAAAQPAAIRARLAASALLDVADFAAAFGQQIETRWAALTGPPDSAANALSAAEPPADH